MSVIQNLDINIRGNSQGVDQAANLSMKKMEDLRKSVDKSSTGITSAMSTATGKITGFGKSFLGIFPGASTIEGFLTPLVSAVKGLGSLTGGLKGATLALGGFAAAGLALGTVWAGLGFSQLGEIEHIGKFASKIGIATETLSGLYHGVRKAGGEVEKLDDFFLKLEEHIGKGGEEVKAAVAKMGLGLQNLKNMAPEEKLYAIADAIKKIGNQTDRIAITAAIGGRGMAGMVGFLQKGSAAMKGTIAEARQMGLVLSEGETARAKSARTAMRQISEAIKGVGYTAAIAIAPFLESMASGISDAITYFSQFKDQIITFGNQAKFVWENFGQYAELYLLDRLLLYITQFANEMQHTFTVFLPALFKVTAMLLENAFINAINRIYAYWERRNRSVAGFFRGFVETAMLTPLTGYSPFGKDVKSFNTALKEATSTLKQAVKRPEGAIEGQLRQQVEATEKRLKQGMAKFEAQQRQKMSMAIPVHEPSKFEEEGKEHQHGAFEHGSKEAFSIIAGTQGDKMLSKLNEQIVLLRQIAAEAAKKARARHPNIVSAGRI